MGSASIYALFFTLMLAPLSPKRSAHCALTICGLILLSACWASPRVEEETQSTAFIHAEVIPIHTPGILSDYTVITHGDRIVHMGPGQNTPLPAQSKVIDLKGKFLLPGFSDMHVHLTESKDLLKFLAHGITRIRNMAAPPDYARLLGTPHVPALKKAVARGEVLSPQVTGCGPFLDGSPPQNSLTTVIDTPEAARAAVQKTVADGYDCVKTYNRLSPEMFAVVRDEAQRLQIPLMGHVPVQVGIEGALNAPMKSIEHLNAYVDNFAGKYRVLPENWQAIAAKTAAQGVYNCPTLVIWDQHPTYKRFDLIENDPRFQTLHWALQLFWKNSLDEVFDITYTDKANYPQHILKLSKPMVKALYDAGAPLLIGTDANFTGIYPGWSALREMELFAQAGIPNAGILEAATLNAARVVGLDHEEGSIEVGKKAQFVVLNENPLQDIHAVHSTVGVMIQGKWLTPEAIRALH